MTNYAKTLACPRHLTGLCDEYRPNNLKQHQISRQKYPECMESCVPYIIFKDLIRNSDSDCIKLAVQKLKPQKEDLQTFQRIKEIKSNIEEFVRKGNNLFITSPHMQCAKSTILFKFLYGYFWQMSCWAPPDEGRGKYVNVPEFAMDIDVYSVRNSDEFRKKIDILKRIDLVVWDDITLYTLNDTAKNIMGSIINSRFRNEKANVFAGLEINNPQTVLGNIIYQQLQTCEHLRITKMYKPNKQKIETKENGEF